MNLIIKVFLVLLLLLNTSGVALGCWCENLGGLAFSSQYSSLIILGEVIKYDSIGIDNAPNEPYSMKVKVLKKIRGNEKAQIIEVFGESGNECRPYISFFKPGEKWILALDFISKGKYNISDCGRNYLKETNSIFIGDIKRPPTVSYDEEKQDSLTLTEIESILNQPEKYPLTEIQQFNLENGRILNCECPPLCPEPNHDKVNIILKDILKKETDFLSEGDSYLLHIKLLIYKNPKYLSFNGILESEKSGHSIPAKLEKNIKREFSKLNCWKDGSGLYNDVQYEALIPIILKK